MMHAQRHRGRGRYFRHVLPLALLALAGASGVAAAETEPATATVTDDCPAPPVSAGTYDYIVVGTGPGGGVLGVNLAKAGYSVLMLEAGGDSNPRSSYDPAVTWDFFAKRYPEGSPLNEQYVRQTWRTPEGRYWVGLTGAPAGSEILGTYYPRGATLGGSSMINYMCTWLPSDSDWEHHYEVTGDASWRADNMHKIFERIEHNNYLPRGAAGHGFDGFFQTNMDHRVRGVPDPKLQGNNVMHVFAQDFNVTDPAYSSMSALLTRDSNEHTPDRDATQSLYGLVRHTYANSTRYSVRYYIREALADSKVNLTLSLHSLATKVVFDQSTSTTGGKPPRATAVEFSVGTALYGGDRRQSYARTTRTCKTAQARREVIVAGGAFNSPQLLMLSGVGPAADLKRLNISVVHDLPGVGQHLMDNQEMPIVGSGWAGDGEASVAMVRSQHAPYAGGKERDTFLMGGPGFVFRGFYPDNQTNNNIPPDPPQSYGVSIVKGSTSGRKGYVRLRTASAFDVPEVNFNLYTDGANDTDLHAMKDIVAWVRTVYARANITTTEPPCQKASGAVAKTGMGTGTATGPNACADEDEAWIYQNTFGHHPTCTNHIGADDDPLAVLDSKFRVRGVAGLRVVDASAFARIPGVFPVAPTFMISQKASDDMLAELKNGTAIAPLS